MVKGICPVCAEKVELRFLVNADLIDNVFHPDWRAFWVTAPHLISGELCLGASQFPIKIFKPKE